MFEMFFISVAGSLRISSSVSSGAFWRLCRAGEGVGVECFAFSSDVPFETVGVFVFQRRNRSGFRLISVLVSCGWRYKAAHLNCL